MCYEYIHVMKKSSHYSHYYPGATLRAILSPPDLNQGPFPAPQSTLPARHGFLTSSTPASPEQSFRHLSPLNNLIMVQEQSDSSSWVPLRRDLDQRKPWVSTPSQSKCWKVWGSMASAMSLGVPHLARPQVLGHLLCKGPSPLHSLFPHAADPQSSACCLLCSCTLSYLPWIYSLTPLPLYYAGS